MEHQANLLWINLDSSYNIHEKWLQNNFKKNERTQILLVKNDNVLTPESINLVINVLLIVTNHHFIDGLILDVWPPQENPGH